MMVYIIIKFRVCSSSLLEVKVGEVWGQFCPCFFLIYNKGNTKLEQTPFLSSLLTVNTVRI